MRPARLAAWLLIAVAPVSARAQEAPSTGIAADRLVPGLGPMTLMAGEGAEVTPRGAVSVSVSGGYLADPIKLVNRFLHTEVSRPVRSQVVTDLGIELGVYKRLAVAIGVPLVISAQGDRLRGTGDDRMLASPAAGDLRLRIKAAFVGDPAQLGLHLAALLQFTAPLGGESDFAATGSVTVEPRLIADVRLPRVVLMAALGARFAGERKVFGTTFSDELTWLAGGAVHLGRRGSFAASLLAEAAGGVGASPGTRPVEVRGGLRLQLGQISLDLGAGAGVVGDVGAPAWRVIGVLRAQFERPRPRANDVVTLRQMALSGRKVLVGVSGGIAAYKAAELVRLLVKGGAQVRVTMTEGAQKFITPLTMQALSQHPVATDTFDLTQESSILSGIPLGTASGEAPRLAPLGSPVGHIALADWADLLVIAPASADVIAKLAHGLAGDVLTTMALACRAPLLVAPAMNVNMWNHPATQSNLRTLTERGAHTVGPDAGDLACGWVGQGRMAEAAEIAQTCARILSYAAPATDLVGVPVLVTAGPTWEPIDPVRYVANRSTGKMGFAVAEAAQARGASVTLVAGPTALVAARGITRVDVETALQMHDAVIARADAMRVVVMVAAVADYRPDGEAKSKLKKDALGPSPSLTLTENPDILAELGKRSYPGTAPVLVGFAAETDDVEKRAVAKRRSKNCALLVANDVTEAGSGFGTDTNRVLLVGPDNQVEHLPQMGKREVAHRILDRVKNLL